MTINQLVKRSRSKKKHKNRVPALGGCAQKKGVCFKVFTVSPKKPNSAVRKVARVILSNKRRVTVAISGIGHRLQEYSLVMVRGGRARDIPGVRLKLVRGKYDFHFPENFVRKNRRSKFGVKRL